MSTGLVYRSLRCCRYKIKARSDPTFTLWYRQLWSRSLGQHCSNSNQGIGQLGKVSSINLDKKQFSTVDSGSNSGGVSESTYKLPRRLVKRLQKQGISENAFISKLKAAEELQYMQQKNWHAEHELNSTVKDYLVNKLPHQPETSEIHEFPSDMPKYRAMRLNDKDETSYKMDPSSTSIVLFPGQGSQFVGMGQNLLRYPGVNELYQEASSILGYDLLKLCLEGPKSELDKTIYCQPSVMITSLAAVERLREEHPNAIENCVATAGFSVGEFAALVFAGVLNFPDAVAAVKVRAEAMQVASEKIASGMLTVFLAHDSNLKEALAMAREYCKERRGIHDPVCYIANYLFPECKVIAGHAAALEFISANYKEFGLLRTKRLPVSGAFHTQLMKHAMQPLQKSLLNIQINKPKIPVYSNLTGQPYHEKANVAHKLGQQLVKPVKWEQTMHGMYARSQGTSFPQTFELGPSKQMGTFLKQINLQAFQSYHNIGV